MKYILLPVCLLLCSACNTMEAIIAEFHEIQETCEVVTNPELYQKYSVDQNKELILQYTFFLEKEKRWYLSGCGLDVDKTNIKFLYGDEIGINSVSLLSYIHVLSLNDKLDIPYYMECIVGGLSPEGTFMNSANKHLIVEKKELGWQCTITTDPGQPYVSGRTSGVLPH